MPKFTVVQPTSEDLKLQSVSTIEPEGDYFVEISNTDNLFYQSPFSFGANM